MAVAEVESAGLEMLQWSRVSMSSSPAVQSESRPTRYGRCRKAISTRVTRIHTYVRVRTNTKPDPICQSAAKSAPRVSVSPRPSTEDESDSRSIIESGCLRARDNV
ncbi:hypothetical protein CRG98_046056 [Punica granatum]|uniref:Uncharacterized protein n=1 Tax=Punica granatum TaxID=22663 RepID=A0A2I0HPT8_PUNGR|nr:hypothetical protein CRG98_046056 [Punica granatum]